MDAALLKQIATLPRNEQLDLAEAIWDGLVAQGDTLPLSDAQRDELDRRLDAMAREPGATLSWDEVRARVGR
jgi:putative addiction module component (TIGR02574 family)